jgi:hypothetical protein
MFATNARDREVTTTFFLSFPVFKNTGILQTLIFKKHPPTPIETKH